MTWIIQKVNSIPTNCGVAYKSVHLLDRGHVSTTIEIFLNRWKHESIDDKINKELINMNDWLKCIRLSLSISKCIYIIFYTPQRKSNPLYLKINDTVIDRVKEFHFLGLTLDENLNWKSYKYNFK